LGLQARPLSSIVPAPPNSATLSFSRASVPTARAIAEPGTSVITSTPSRSNQLRAMVAPTSGLL